MASEQRHINTGGGDYAAGNVNKWQGISMPGSTVEGTIAGVVQQQTNYYTDGRKSLNRPQLLLPILPGYIARPSAEQKLLNKFTAANAQQLLLLHGRSGVGKSSLVAAVLRRLSKEDYPGGILAGSLHSLSPNDLLLNFLHLLDPTWRYVDHDNQILRDLFWTRLADAKGRILLVFDDLHNEQQLAELLPLEQSDFGLCRILIISTSQFTLPEGSIAFESMHLTGMEIAEVEQLFSKAIGAAEVEHYREPLRSICERLEYIPLYLVSVARKFARRAVTPIEYAATLPYDQYESNDAEAGVPTIVEHALRGLTPDQEELFALLNVLGLGDWHMAMLAALALHPVTTVRDDLQELTERGLVKLSGDGRYQVNTVVRALAEQRFNQLDAHRQQTAFVLLARYCLDIAQDCAADLCLRPEFQDSADNMIDRISEAFVEAFRAALLPERSHILKALEWATRHQLWDLLLRFSFLPPMELLNNFVADGGEMQLSMCMARLLEPVVWEPTDRPNIHFQSLITSGYWRRRLPEGDAQSAGRTPQEREDRDEDQARCDLLWDITAGQIVSGVVRDARLIYSHWIGVRAPNIVCRRIDVVGGAFLTCDFSNSVWFNCDARHVVFQGSNFSYALLRRVQLHGADLQNANFFNGVLEHVALRSANLQQSNFTSAVLRDVDLRGADLRGASFAHAQFYGVDLSGCDLQGVYWSGARGIETVTVDNQLQHSRIRTSAAFVEGKPPRVARKRPAHVNEIASRTELGEWDLRALNFDQRTMAGAVFNGSDLRSASLQGANLQGSNLRNADLRDADLAGADLSAAALDEADLRAAVLAGAKMHNCRLNGATLRSARLLDARMGQASLVGASLRGADLTRARLRRADLTGADLSMVVACGAYLDQARLDRASLVHADLSGARLSGAVLQDAICTATRFDGAEVADEQLAQAERLGGAILSDGTAVAVIRGYDSKKMPLPPFLRFSEWSGSVVDLVIDTGDLFGARLDAIFVDVQFANVDLTYARLLGKFADTSLAGATLRYARLSAIFADVDFQKADFANANLSGSTFVNCNLQGAKNLGSTQLRQARRLRGTTMPDGTRYAGQFNLSGDIEDAIRKGINPRDHHKMLEEFYNKSFVSFSLPADTSL